MRTWPVWFGLAMGLVALATGFVAGGTTAAEDWQLAARYTARAAFLLFLAVYCARPLVQLWPSTWNKALLRDRRWWGLGFAASHTVHLAALTMANITMGEVPSVQSLAGGGLAYGLIYVMAATSTDRAQRVLGIWWKRVHRVGIHWIWFVFTFSYFGRLFDRELVTVEVVFFPIAMLAAGLRLAAWFRSRRRRSPGGPLAFGNSQ